MKQFKTNRSNFRCSGMATYMRKMEETLQMHEHAYVDGINLLIQTQAGQRESIHSERNIRNAAFRCQAILQAVSFDVTRRDKQAQEVISATDSDVRNAAAILTLQVRTEAVKNALCAAVKWSEHRMYLFKFNEIKEKNASNITSGTWQRQGKEVILLTHQIN